MIIKTIKSTRDYKAALARMEELWGSKSSTPAGDELDILATLVDKYEEENFPIPMPDPIEAIKYVMEERGLERTFLENIFGHKSKVSEVLNRKRELSKKMIKSLHEVLGIPYEILMK